MRKKKFLYCKNNQTPNRYERINERSVLDHVVGYTKPMNLSMSISSYFLMALLYSIIMGNDRSIDMLPGLIIIVICFNYSLSYIEQKETYLVV